MMMYTYDSFVQNHNAPPFLLLPLCPLLSELLVVVGWQRFLRRDRGTYGPEIKAGKRAQRLLFFRVCVRACTCWCDVKDDI